MREATVILLKDRLLNYVKKATCIISRIMFLRLIINKESWSIKKIMLHGGNKPGKEKHLGRLNENE